MCHSLSDANIVGQKAFHPRSYHVFTEGGIAKWHAYRKARTPAGGIMVKLTEPMFVEGNVACERIAEYHGEHHRLPLVVALIVSSSS